MIHTVAALTNVSNSWGFRVGGGSHLSLHHSGPLGPERLHCLEKIDHPFVPHPLQHDAEGDEDPGPAHAGTVDTNKHTRVKMRTLTRFSCVLSLSD